MAAEPALFPVSYCEIYDSIPRAGSTTNAHKITRDLVGGKIGISLVIQCLERSEPFSPGEAGTLSDPHIDHTVTRLVDQLNLLDVGLTRLLNTPLRMNSYNASSLFRVYTERRNLDVIIDVYLEIIKSIG